ncbi:MAG TPA: carboxypeptidase regulatory-like domain-containing protein, partial [Gemmatimonadaceae bacterium]|nr:carboxypeptidase regulatory-like domain-containing protein [Gemmatimonadaceae bacterium]
MHSRLARLAIAAASLVACTASAQGVADASIVGISYTRAGDTLVPIPAQIVIVNRATGARLNLRTDPNGRFSAEHLSPGGPYRVEARAGGRRETRDGITLSLGQRLSLRLVLAPDTARLEEVVVRAQSPALSPSHMGASHTVSDSAIRRLPLLSRDFTELLQTAPEVTGTSVSGSNNRMNDIQVDGASNNDYFGLSRGTGTPGGQEGARSLPLEAVQEFQIQTAPFDVRQGSFTGGQINAITRSGTNAFHGSLFGFYQGQGLAGHDTAGRASPDFNVEQYGGSVGGPIIENRLHFFAAGELRHRVTPFSGPTIGSATNVGITADSAQRFASLLNGYGIAPGSFGVFNTTSNAQNVFAKLSAVTGKSGSAELSINYAHGITEDSISPARAINGDYRLTSAAFAPEATTWAGHGKWTTVFGAWSNELLAGYAVTNEPRSAASDAPAIFVQNVGAAGTRLIAGADPSSQLLTLRQRDAELTDNVTRTFGAHAVTVGAAAELMHFTFGNFSNAIGQYAFFDLDSLAAGRPSRFMRNLALDPGAATSDFGVHQYSLYAQDAWSASRDLVITLGLRADRSSFPDAPRQNDALAASSFGVSTSAFIAPVTQLSPRLGFHWSVRDGTALRGGVGVFTGRDPYSWMSFAYSNTGTGVVLLNCANAAAPDFVPDPGAQPTSCAGGGVPASAASLSYFVNDFRLPQALKTALGADQQLPWNMVASLDFTFVHGMNALYITDDNLAGPVGTLSGEGGRVMYGAVGASSKKGSVPTVTPSVVSSAFGPILRNDDRSGDRTYIATAQIQKSWSNGTELGVAYTHMSAKDYFSLRDAQSVSNYGFSTVDGSLESRNLAISTYDIPNKITITATRNLPWGFQFSAIYLGRSGTPYTFIVNGDANGDGVGNKVGAFDRQADDAIYVPTGPSDITLVRDSAASATVNVLVPAHASAYDSLEAYINGQPCLRNNRGRILPRNACTNPWQNILNARVTKSLRMGPGERDVELIADVFNVPNLLNGRWGLIRETGTLSGAGTEDVPLLRLRGTDPA